MAVADYFLKIDGVEGESQDAKHPNEIHLLSWAFSESNIGTSSAGGGSGAGKVHMQDFHFTMNTCKASPKLFLACASGEHIKKGVLVCRKAGKDQQEYLKWTFSDLLISSFATSGSGGSDNLPMDQVSFNFSKAEVEYKEQNPDGTLKGPVKAGYDVKKMDKV